MPVIPALRKLNQKDYHEVKATFNYIVTSRLAWVTMWDHTFQTWLFNINQQTLWDLYSDISPFVKKSIMGAQLQSQHCWEPGARESGMWEQTGRNRKTLSQLKIKKNDLAKLVKYFPGTYETWVWFPALHEPSMVCMPKIPALSR